MAYEIFVLGSSGFAKEVQSYILDDNRYTCANTSIYYVDRESLGPAIGSEEYKKRATKLLGLIHGSPFAANCSLNIKCYTILGSGKPEIKRMMLKEAIEPFLTIAHDRAYVSKCATVGKGSVVAPHAMVANNAVIGKHVLINYGSTIGHDSIIGDLSVVSPNASVGGWVKIGEGSYIGSGAQIREKLIIGNNTIIGMGAIVTKNIPDDCVVIGNPAKIYTLEEWKEIKNGRAS